MADTKTKVVTLPDVLPYAPFIEFTAAQYKNLFCYILEGYPRKGIALMIYRESGDAFIRTADFDGNVIDPTKVEAIATVMKEFSYRFITTMKVIGLKQAIFYLSETKNGFRLVDMRLALDRFCGPGAINDYFGRQGLAVQKVINEPLILTDENLEMLITGKGDYAGPLVVKPSAFKFTLVDGQPTPLYGVLREIKVPT